VPFLLAAVENRRLSASLAARAARAIDRAIAPAALFVTLYGGLLLLAAHLVPAGSTAAFHLLGLGAVAAATAISVAIADRGRFDVGLRRPAPAIASYFGAGLAGALVLLGAADLLLVAAGALTHEWSGRFPWREAAVLYVPAVVHEELLFRGYAFQKLASSSRTAAVAASSVLFALLHTGNQAFGTLAFVNIALAGVLLSVAWLVARSLWLPIGIHLGWNLAAGPLLGHEVSGHIPAASLLTASDVIPSLTGGAFGIEGSPAVTVAELAGIAILLALSRRGIRKRGDESTMLRNSEGKGIQG
jgi:uncharacterized protein